MRSAATTLALGVAATALALSGFIVLATNGTAEWFVHFGSREPKVVDFALDILGPDTLTPHTQGHDGGMFWLLARDPLLLHPATAREYNDRPTYRSQRILYPLLAAPGRLAGEDGLVWALLAVNIVALGAGTYVTARLAEALGAPTRAGLAFALNPAVWVGFLLDASDTLAIALVMAALLAAHRQRARTATTCFALAALAKEIMLLVPLALWVTDVIRGRGWRRGAAQVGWVLAAVGGWATYVRFRLGWESAKIEELAAPWTGFRDAWRYSWRPYGDWGQAAITIALLLVAVAIVVRFAKRRSDILVGALPFALLFPELSAQVLGLVTNAPRALGPAITMLALDAYQQRGAA